MVALGHLAEPAKPVDTMALTVDGPAHPLPTDTDNLPRGVDRQVSGFSLGSALAGWVWCMRHMTPDLDRKVAIKLLRPREQDAEEAKRRTHQIIFEAQAMARLSPQCDHGL